MGISTTLRSRDLFMNRLATLLAKLIEYRIFDGDWAYQLEAWLQCAGDVVMMQTLADRNIGRELPYIIQAGKAWLEDPTPCAAIDEDGNVYTHGVRILEVR